MTDKFDWFWFDLKYQMRKALESLQFGIAWALPRWLVYFATVRCIAHATTGKYGSTDVSEVRAMTVLKRWETPNEK